jgi:hypothetical protein
MKFPVFILLCFSLVSPFVHGQHKTENVILVTLDGMRWQEIFGGAESKLIANKKFVEDTAALKKKFWAETPGERREKLMPFFWHVIAAKGQLYGNRTLGNKVNTANTMWFSYPGYNEILTGSADDEHITSNDAIDNPNRNVLEFINQQKGWKGKVAAFTSWETFPWIINTKRNGIPVNAGLMKAQSNPNGQEKLLDELLFQLPNITGDTRLDGLTFHYAFEYLKKSKPRVLYLAFDETDHFAHEGQYDRYLASAHYIDGFIGTLWAWAQSQPEYKDKTTILITADHGRGNKNEADWRDHGSKMPDADQIWIAILGPDTPGLGEVKNEQQLYQKQVAKTLAAFLGVDYAVEGKKTGDVIPFAAHLK